MTAPNVKATAVVTVTVEVRLTQPWGQECKLDQVFKQAKRDAVDDVRRKLNELRPNYRIVGEPIVKAILAEEER